MTNDNNETEYMDCVGSIPSFWGVSEISYGVYENCNNATPVSSTVGTNYYFCYNYPFLPELVDRESICPTTGLPPEELTLTVMVYECHTGIDSFHITTTITDNGVVASCCDTELPPP